MAWHYGTRVKQIYVGNRRPSSRTGGALTAVNWETSAPGATPILDVQPMANISFLAYTNNSIVDPTYVTIHKTGKWAVLASTGNHSIGVVPLNLDPVSRSFLSFGEAINLPPYAVGNFSHEAVFDQSGKYLFVPCRNSDFVRMMIFDEITGALTNNGEISTAMVPSGNGPRHMTLHPRLPKAYVVNELGNTVATFDYDNSTGLLSANFEMEANRLLSTLPLGAPDCSSETAKCTQAAAEVLISPDGRFLYASNRGTGGGVNNIAIFSIGLTPNVDLGLLTPIGYADGDGDIQGPRQMSLTPGRKGEFLLVANEPVNSVTVLSRSMETGLLTKVQTLSLEGIVGRPSFVAVVHPNSVY
jgi:6-phosphogluconolactonase (cycloisomerase 2 family)